jgi:protein-L-isoaspartate(D-aspartate) O-methyltransferase
MSWVLLVGLLLAGYMAHGGEAELRLSEAELRSRMVSLQIAGRGVRDARVLRAMGEVPRHEFVPPELGPFAYRDTPLPIGHGQTISQPYIVAVMSELAQLKPGDRVLEVGTGSGYQAAVLAALGTEVYSIELLPELAAQAAATLNRLGYRNIQLRQGDGFAGWPSAAPFEAIIVTAAPPKVPPRLLEQLADGGRLVIPVGDATQQLEVHTRDDETIKVKSIFPVRFVPMRGAVEDSVPGTTEPPKAP